jgi:fluoride ion exporter CrcB/FEX
LLPVNWSTVWRAFLGGALGTLLRLGAILIGTQPTALFIVNLVGAAFIGWANGDRRFDGNRASAFWKVGFAGGFTTMSGVSLFLAAPGSGLKEVVLAVFMMGLGIWAYRIAKYGASKWRR